MPKTVDIPIELRPFNKIFERLSYGLTYSQVFGDYLQLVMCEFGRGLMRNEYEETAKRYTRDKLLIIDELFRCMIHTFDKIFADDPARKFYDFFGTFYEVLASSC